jgi:hypothetical protein
MFDEIPEFGVRRALDLWQLLAASYINDRYIVQYMLVFTTSPTGKDTLPPSLMSPASSFITADVAPAALGRVTRVPERIN